MRKVMLVANLVSVLSSVVFFLYVSIYGPVVIISYENIANSCVVTASDTAVNALPSNLKAARKDFYYFLLVPLFGFLLLGGVSLANIILLAKLKETSHVSAGSTARS